MAAAEAAASLLFSATKGLRNAGQSLSPAERFLVQACTQLLTGLHREGEKSHENFSLETCEAYACALERCLRICWLTAEDANNRAGLPSGTSAATATLRIPPNMVVAAVQAMVDSIRRSVVRQGSEGERLSQEGYDPADVEEMLAEHHDAESELVTYLVDSIGYTLKTHGEDFLPTFDSVVAPFILPLVQEGQPPAWRHNAICLYDDVIEFCGTGATKYAEQMLPVMLKYAGDENALLRQASIYGLKQVAKHAPGVFATHAPLIIMRLQQVISDPNSRSEDSIGATENAVSALGFICRHHANSPSVDIASILPAWVQCLPLSEDEVEAQASHALLCDFVAEGNEYLFGQQREHTPHIMRAFGGILVGAAGGGGDDVPEPTTEETLQRIPQLLKQLQAGLPAEVMQNAWSQLGPAEQSAIQRAVDC